jgi:UDPglucose 6-dehydrogenase
VSKPKAGVVGGGVVGSAMQKLCGPDTVVYDPNRAELAGNREAVNGCDVAFVCVPTPMADDGSCSTQVVEEVVAWVQAPLIIIRSTIAPGTTDRLRAQFGKRVVFQPEYLGETTAHVFGNMAEREFVVLGGAPEDVSAAADFYKHFYNSYVRYYFCDAVTAEVAKYMENAFYAVKVTFVNEFHEIARVHGVDFNLLREIWLADPRISRDHTFVYPQARGFSGKCLPKDCNAIIQSSLARGYQPKLMQQTLKINEDFLRMNRR